VTCNTYGSPLGKMFSSDLAGGKLKGYAFVCNIRKS